MIVDEVVITTEILITEDGMISQKIVVEKETIMTMTEKIKEEDINIVLYVLSYCFLLFI